MCHSRKTFLLQFHYLTVYLNFAKDYIEKNDEFLKKILWSDETKIELFGHNDMQHVWRKVGEVHSLKNIVPAVNHGVAV